VRRHVYAAYRPVRRHVYAAHGVRHHY
jgi:hypothetical protein